MKNVSSNSSNLKSKVDKSDIDNINKLVPAPVAPVKSSTYIDSSREINDKNSKLKIGDIVRISKYESIFAKGYVPNWSEKVFLIKKVKNTVLYTYIISDLSEVEIGGTFCGKELQKTNQKEFRVEKLIRKKSDKLYVKWKGYNISCNSSIDKKDIV